jgi:hypothetical protein
LKEKSTEHEAKKRGCGCGPDGYSPPFTFHFLNAITNHSDSKRSTSASMASVALQTHIRMAPALSHRLCF